MSRTVALKALGLVLLGVIAALVPIIAPDPATTNIGVEGFQSIDSLVVKADGAVAWIATANSIGKPTFVRQLQRLDTRGFAVLDSGRDVNAASLRLHGSRLSWKHATAVRTATLR